MCACGRSSLLTRSASSRPPSACFLFQLFALTTIGLLTLGPSLSAGFPISEFFPFNSSFGDKTTNRKDDGGSGEIRLMVKFPFFGRHYNQVHVNNNGIITFNDHFSSYRPDDFPMKENITMIAPFWADVDVNKSGGYIWYRQTREPYILAKAQKEIRKLLPAYRTFRAYWAFVATWDNVGFYGANEIGLTRKNTFQAVLLLDYTGRVSFVILNYGRLQWTTGTNSRGNRSTGLGGAPAQAGFNAGNGVDYFELDGAQTAAVLNLTLTSNVGVPGKWILRVDSRSSLNPCATTDVFFTPNFGTMMGGNLITVSGPCIPSDLHVVGRIDETNDTFCCFNRDGQTQCVTPLVFNTGLSKLSLNVGYGGWNYTGQFEFKNVMDTQSGLLRVNPEKWRPGETVELIIQNGSGLVTASSYWVDFLEYSVENDFSDLQLISSLSVQRLKENDRISVTVPFALSVSHLAVVRVRATLSFCASSKGPSIYSDVFPVYPTSSSQSQAICSSWLESHLRSRPLSSSGYCPCTLDQAEGDTGQYTEDPLCYRDSKWPLNCQYRSRDAGECIIPNETSDAGSYVCCYDKDSHELLNALDGRGGGTRERFLLRETSPNVWPYFTYMSQDIIPYLQCCLYSSNDTLCEAFLQHRPPVDCQGYETPAAAQASGDPHIETLDGNRYTFNGIGEFILLRVKGSDAVVQVRTAQAVNMEGQSQNATVFTSIALQASNSSSIVEIRLDNTEDNLFSVFVDKKPVELTSSTSKFNGITVYSPVDESEDDGETASVPTTATSSTTTTTNTSTTSTTTMLSDSLVTAAPSTTTSIPEIVFTSMSTPQSSSTSNILRTSIMGAHTTQTQFGTSSSTHQLSTFNIFQTTEIQSSTTTFNPPSGHTGTFERDTSSTAVPSHTTIPTFFTHTADVVPSAHYVDYSTTTTNVVSLTSTTTVTIMSPPILPSHTIGTHHSSQASSHSTSRTKRSTVSHRLMFSTSAYARTIGTSDSHWQSRLSTRPSNGQSTLHSSNSLHPKTFTTSRRHGFTFSHSTTTNSPGTARRHARSTSQLSSLRTQRQSTQYLHSTPSRQAELSRVMSNRFQQTTHPLGKFTTNSRYHLSTSPQSTYYRKRRSISNLPSIQPSGNSSSTYRTPTFRTSRTPTLSSSNSNSTDSGSASWRSYNTDHDLTSVRRSFTPPRITSKSDYSTAPHSTSRRSYNSAPHSASWRSYNTVLHSTSIRSYNTVPHSTSWRSYNSAPHSTSWRSYNTVPHSTSLRSYNTVPHSTSWRSVRTQNYSTHSSASLSSPRTPPLSSSKSYASILLSTSSSHNTHSRSTSRSYRPNSQSTTWNFGTRLPSAFRRHSRPKHSSTFRLKRHEHSSPDEKRKSVQYANRTSARDRGNSQTLRPFVGVLTFHGRAGSPRVQSNLTQRVGKYEEVDTPKSSRLSSRPQPVTFTEKNEGGKASRSKNNIFEKPSVNSVHSDTAVKSQYSDDISSNKNKDEDKRNLMDKNRNAIDKISRRSENDNHKEDDVASGRRIKANGNSLTSIFFNGSFGINRQKRDTDALVSETDGAAQAAASSSQEAKRSKRSEVTVVMESLGLSVLIQVTPDLMNFMTVAAPNLKGRLEGLLGNYNGDSTDDLVDRNGTLLSPSASMRDVHDKFGMSWEVKAVSTSLFASDSPLLSSDNPEDRMLTFNNLQDSQSFTPVFIDELQMPSITTNVSTAICGGNMQCDFDYLVTGREDIAVSTLDFSVMFEKRKQELQPVVRCPRPATIPNGNRTVTGQKIQDTVTYQCYKGFQFVNGSGVLTCLSSGKWDQRTPVCVKVLQTGDDFPLLYVAIGAAVGGFVVVLLFFVALVGLHRRCKREASKKGESSSDHDTAIELPTIFPISDIPSPVFENPTFMSSLQKLSEKGSFRIPRPTYVDPSIYSEYF